MTGPVDEGERERERDAAPAGDGVGEAAAVSGPLPDAVRGQVLALAAERLATMPEDEVPPTLRAVRRFTPAKRARLGAPMLAAALEGDAAFRLAVADSVRSALPGLVVALEASPGALPPLSEPAQAGAAAYLLRAPGWEQVLAAVRREEANDAAAAARAAESRELELLQGRLSAARAEGRAELGGARAEVAEARRGAEEARRELRIAGERVRRAEAALREELSRAEGERDAARAARADAELDARRLRVRLGEVEAALDLARRSGREARAVDDVRLRVLLDTLLAAASGVRRELALPPVLDRPADAVSAALAAGTEVVDPLGGIGVGLGADDAELVDRLLAVPGIHLVVDGYNVTKTGYGTLPLEAQRGRLLAGLGALVARVGAEVTCVFDGGAVSGRLPAVTAPRGVRVLFSPPGQIADEVIVRLVREEPTGRPVAVVTSDREVAEAVARAGARALPSVALLSRLSRG